ncbi:uncharacterized protein LOC143378731 [Andrena cerasifolii]|uniref:uncharacterized protein LOC143378731 n=1 Tax=Andrena cerasifolii TaxID=2819439 RepID=UPI004038171B
MFYESSKMNKKSDSDSTFVVPTTKKIKRQAFREAWLQNSYFKPWLQPADDPLKAKCTVCSKLLRAKKSHLDEHAKSDIHIMKLQQKTGASISVRSFAAISSSDTENDSSSDSTSVVPAAKKAKRQAFRKAWLQNPYFKPWLQQAADPLKAKCTVCSKLLIGKKSHLEKHAKSHVHIMNLQQKAGASTSVPSNAANSSSDTENDSSNDSIFITSTAKKVKGRRQAFRQAWLEDAAFKSWLQQVQDDPYKGKCTICCKYITASKYNLQHHANSQEHIKNVKYGIGSLTSTDEATRNFSDELKVAEIRVCIDAIEHNRSFHSFIHFMRMLQKTLPDQHLLKCMSLNPKKMTAITKNVINKYIITKTIENVQDKFFSVLIDETTDISDMKIVCFLIRYVHKGQICIDLLDLIRIKECTAENVYRCFRHSSKKYNLPITNMVGVCVDNANVMEGAHNSLTSRLVADNGEICILPCICHSIHLAARQACECLPQYVEKFLHSLYSYYSRNPKQLSMLEGTQQFMKVAKRKVTQPTRWLAQSECIKRVLNQWTVLFSVFAEESSEKHADVAKRIFSSFNCPYTKAYLQFMDYILAIFTELNKLLQSSKILVHRLLPECYRLLKTLGGNFLKSKYLKEPNIHKINVNNADNLLPLTKMFTGAGCMATLSKIANGNLEGNEDMMQFYTNIQKCYQSAFQNIVNGVPFDDTFLNALDFLNPQTALDIDKHRHDQLNCILNKFNSKFDHDIVVNEWHVLPFTFAEEAKEKLQVMSLHQFWHEMSITTNAEDERILPNISKLAQLCLSLPHSNADVERYFSTLAQIKTRDRNRLNTETIAAITRIKLDLKNKNAHWDDYKITDDMLNLFDNSMYNKEKIPEELIGILLPDETNESTSDSDNN